ncbi:hypothetical protein E4U59_001026 [Claviceps monticola]|nr:hypothetical protein E4U59_001026 [Claviceps monticola]
MNPPRALHHLRGTTPLSTARATRRADRQAALDAFLYDATALFGAEVAEGGADADGLPSLVEFAAEAFFESVAGRLF